MQSQHKKVESAQQLLERFAPRNNALAGINPTLFPNGGPTTGQAIEVTGPNVKELLVDFISRCILPESLGAEFKGTGVLLLNTEHHLSVVKISQVINARLKAHKLDSLSRKDAIESALRNIYVAECFNGDQLEMTLKNLVSILTSKDHINLIVLDNIHSYFYCAKQRDPKLGFVSHSKKIMNLIYPILKTMEIVLVFGRYDIFMPENGLNLDVDYRITCNRSQICIVDYAQEISSDIEIELGDYIEFVQRK